MGGISNNSYLREFPNLRKDSIQPLMFRFPALLLPLLATGLLLPSCQTCRFYGQAINGQMEILRKSRPIPAVCADPATPPGLRRQLAAVEEIRCFASVHLSLPAHESYGTYADLDRRHLIWVTYAAPEFSLEPKTWKYPLIGELDYRGYFNEHDAIALAGKLRAEHYDVCIGGVDAYSTLGWFHDPILNTFVDYPDIDLAETLFHEITHRKVFLSGQTTYNESLANVVAEEGVKRWLKHQGRFSELRRYEQRLIRRREFDQKIDSTRSALEKLYSSSCPAPVMRRKKAEIFVRLRDQFRELRRNWGGRGLESWLTEDLNNGHIVSLKIYAQDMPALQNLLTSCKGDLNLFFKKAGKQE
jgi:predicted aminopeptidase